MRKIMNRPHEEDLLRKIQKNNFKIMALQKRSASFAQRERIQALKDLNIIYRRRLYESVYGFAVTSMNLYTTDPYEYVRSSGELRTHDIIHGIKL